MADSHDWVELWRRVAEADAQGSRRLVGDVCGGLDLVTDSGGPDDPDEIIALAIAGAKSAEATAAGLGLERALYTPQQAAVVASALYAQIERGRISAGEPGRVSACHGRAPRHRAAGVQRL
ncbi:hypothetical protein ACFRU3_44005 [Streptomyces sp. NPDC056910]|uniref:hypothetical protein n=1 Tax=Streptomyces sp. NPDC056910 TaxID=3345964 RepID=UPI0036A48EA4